MWHRFRYIVPNIIDLINFVQPNLGVLGHVLKQVIPPIPYSDIPNFPHASIPGHEGQLVVGTIEEIPLVVFQGRVHAYQGFSLAQVTTLEEQITS